MSRRYPLVSAILAAALVGAAIIPAFAQNAAPAKPTRFARLIARVDTDRDGTISLAEAQAFAAARFDRLDAAHRGYLTLEDWQAPLRRAIDRASDTRKPRLEKALPRLEAAFRAMNKSGDGRLTKAEFLADSSARFAAADADHDGALSLAELQAARGHAF